MASLIDIFNPSFFVFLGILVLVVALLVVYFETKMREQNHKITSMFSLVSSMADELNNLKYSFSLIVNPNTEQDNHTAKVNNNEDTLKGGSTNLIQVSDDEEDDDDDSVVSSSSSSSCKSSEFEGEEENEIIQIGTEIKDNYNTIKVLNMTSFSLKGGDDINDIDDVDDICDNIEDILEDDESSSSEDEKYDSNHVQNSEEIPNDFSFKSINISSFDDDSKISTEIDYKKISLGRLRKIVHDKGLAEDTSKLKKNELLKLLGVV
jgi:hypothetical protein